MPNDDRQSETNRGTTTPTRRDVATDANRERASLIERAKREVPALRERVASNLAELHRIANQ
jgi:hypothetical protein